MAAPPQAHGIRDIPGSGFEALRRQLIDCLLEGDVLNHVAAALPRWRVLEDFRLAIDDADAGGRKHLMPGENVEVAVQRLHVHTHMRDGLRTVDQNLGAMAVRGLYHGLRGNDGTERVGHLWKRNQARARAKQLFVFIEKNLATVVDGRDTQLGALFPAQHLPGHDVGVVLEPGDHDLVVLLDVLPSPALGHQVDALGCATNEDDFAG